MSTANRCAALFVIMACLSAPSSLTAREFNTAQGQLLRMDTSAHKLVIRTEQGSQLQCTFNGETRITGYTDNIASLRKLSHLTVHYAKDQMEFVATEIEVHGTPF